MTVAAIMQVKTALTEAGFGEELVAEGEVLRSQTTGVTHPPADLTVAQLIRFRGITAREEEGLLFALATADGRPLGTYMPTFHPSVSNADAGIISRLHERVITDTEVRSHKRHDHIAAVFAERRTAAAAVAELRAIGLGSDRLGLAIREGADRAFERDAESEVVRDMEVGVAAGGALGFLAGMSIAAIALVPGGLIGLGGILALGVPSGLAGAVLGGYLGDAAAERSFMEREELLAFPLEPGQILVAACSHGHAETVRTVLERHGGQLLLRTPD